jgi:soluble lytic murein transglycosylase-like protein
MVWVLRALVGLALLPIGACGDRERTALSRDEVDNAATRAPEAPKPDEGIPLDRDELAKRLGRTRAALAAEIDRWLADEDRNSDAPPDVTLYALYEQRIYLALTSRDRLARAVLERLDGELAAEADEILEARRALSSLSTPQPRRRFRTGPARPARVLLRYYREAEDRFGVAWRVLTAVNFVESAFNRLRNKSTAGARGPMQFLPSTWDAYGMGGDIDDPRDAIMGAANYLHASGAPGDYRAALYAYNPSDAYVKAVLNYARLIRRDRHRYFAFHSWQVFVRTPDGIERITGPGLAD